jgi:hypothetical protein
MSGEYPPGPGTGSVGKRIEEAIELIEMELRHAITYVNDAVIPQVRRESISAMRTAADTLHNLADRFEQRTNQAESQPGNQPPTARPPFDPSNSDLPGNDPANSNSAGNDSPQSDLKEPRS